MGYPTHHPVGTAAVGTARISYAATLGLGVVIFFIGFASVYESGGATASYFGSGLWFAPSFFLVGGLLTVPGLLPRAGGAPGFLPVAVTVPAALGQLFSAFAISSKGTGFILILVFGLLQMISAVAGFLLETGLVAPPARPAYAGPPPGSVWPGAHPGQYPGGQSPAPNHPQYGGGYGQLPGFAPQPQPGGFGQPQADVSQPGWYGGGSRAADNTRDVGPSGDRPQA